MASKCVMVCACVRLDLHRIINACLVAGKLVDMGCLHFLKWYRSLAGGGERLVHEVELEDMI